MNVTVKKIERVILRRGSTATVVSKPRSVGLRILRGGNLIPIEPQVTDLVAQYILLAN